MFERPDAQVLSVETALLVEVRAQVQNHLVQGVGVSARNRQQRPFMCDMVAVVHLIAAGVTQRRQAILQHLHIARELPLVDSIACASTSSSMSTVSE